MRPAGIVLAGGRSTRMGTPKAWLDWHGTTLLDRVVRVVSRAVDGGPIVVVRAPGQELPDLPEGVTIVEDAAEGQGPLEGLAAGLEELAGAASAAFVSSTDAAFLHPAFARRVLAALEPEVDAAVPHARGHRQPLAAAYRTSLAPLVHELLAAGERKPAFLLERCRTVFLDEAFLLADPVLATADPELASLENLNDPDSYRAALARPVAEVEIEVFGSLRNGDQPSRLAAATIGEAAGRLGLELGAHVVAALNGDRISADPLFPLAAGDRLAFLAADAGG
jgi:molybdopterin-guanine dinucleotide biosynthesis protein A